MHKIPKEELLHICESFDGEYGLYAYVEETGESFGIHENKIFRAASTIKVPLLALLLKDGETGRLDLNRPKCLAPENRVGGTGILQSLAPELALNLYDIAELMIVLSDNSATNEVIDAVEIHRFNDFCREEGFENTGLGRKMMMGGNIRQYSAGEKPLNYTTAGDLGEMMKRIIHESFVSTSVSRRMLGIMAGQRLAKLSSSLPTVDRFDPREIPELPPVGYVVAATKGGTLTSPGISHDTGVFILPDGRRYALTVCTQTSNVKKALDGISACSKSMYEAMIRE